MDIISHGLWGSLAFGRRDRKHFLLAFFFGIAPDLFSFGPFFIAALFGYADLPSFAAGPPPENAIPGYVHLLYPFTHSAVIFAMAFVAVWVVRRRPAWEMAAWGLHILLTSHSMSIDFSPHHFCGRSRHTHSADGRGATH